MEYKTSIRGGGVIYTTSWVKIVKSYNLHRVAKKHLTRCNLNGMVGRVNRMLHKVRGCLLMVVKYGYVSHWCCYL
jgi:hypothetical protein